MIKTSIRDMSISLKLFLIVLLGALPLFIVILFYIRPLFENKMMDQKKAELTHLVESAYSLLEMYDQKIQSGTLNKEEAQTLAKDQISKMKYDGANYFWINDFEPKMIMHPNYSEKDKPEWYAENGLADYKDSKGKKLFVAFVDVCQKSGFGYVDYLWTKPGKSKEIYFPKLSYVKSFESWGWIIGSGVYVDDVKIAASKIVNRFSLIFIILILFAIVLISFYARNLNKGLAQTMKVAKSLADGDLTRQVKITSMDELGLMMESLNTAMNSLRAIISNILSSASKLSVISGTILKSSNSQKLGMQNQADMIQNTNASMEEVSASIQQISEKTVVQAKAVDTIGKTMQDVLDSIASVAELSKSVENSSLNTQTHFAGITDSYSESLAAIHNIELSAVKINSIIDVIKDIADQTNLLALNASIEAARAGEAGRGFSVVAKEISKLSDKSILATREIEALVNETAKNVSIGSEKVNAIDEQLKSIISIVDRNLDASRKMTEATKSQLESSGMIRENVSQLASMAQDIAATAEEQSAAISSISKTMESIDLNTAKVVEESSSNAEEAKNLELSADELNSLVKNFKI